jgi:hypothetical protein
MIVFVAVLGVDMLLFKQWFGIDMIVFFSVLGVDRLLFK